MQPRIRFVCAALLAGLMFLAGCGQKGPLYLPEEQDLPEEEGMSETPAPAADIRDPQDAD